MSTTYTKEHKDKEWTAFFKLLEQHVSSDKNPRPVAYYECRDEQMPFDSKLVKHLNNVLIVGERGTGKELLAQEIAAQWHDQQATPALPTQARFNCAGWSEELARAELFGYVKGAYTGANKNGYKGLLTRFPIIFLDEVHRLPQSIQAMLLRLIEYGEYQPIGGAAQRLSPMPHLIAAAQPLAIEPSSSFLPDLLDRFHYRITIPPLNATPSHIVRLFVICAYSTLLRRHYTTNQIKSIEISSRFLVDLLCHNWRGNIRELNNVAMQLHVDDYELDYNFPDDMSILRHGTYTILRSLCKQGRPKGMLFEVPLTHPIWKKLSESDRDYFMRKRNSYTVWPQIFHAARTNRDICFSLLDLWELPPFDLGLRYCRYRADYFLSLNVPDQYRQKLQQQKIAAAPKPREPGFHQYVMDTLKKAGNDVSHTADICGCTKVTVRAHRDGKCKVTK